ncbi:MAG: hypothetical protein WCO84_02525 [bacterium]
MNNQTTVEKGMIRLADTDAMASFRQGVDGLLQRRQYFIDRLLPTLKENIDFYNIKGRRSLGKSGCEKLCGVYSLTATFTRDNETMIAFQSIPGLIAYICTLYRNGEVMGQGRGASTLEKNEGDPNKTIKMAQKSAYIDSTIRATGLSDLFSQDLEDMQPVQIKKVEAPKEIPLITPRQKELLTSLIKRNSHNEKDRANWLSELEGGMTKAEASDMISSFIGIR